MATILVTGGAGFIGSALVRQLIAETGDQVVNVDKLTYAGHLQSLGDARHDPRHRFEQVDIRDGMALARVMEASTPDAIVHLAAESHVDRSIDAPAAFVQTNVLGTVTLLEVADRYWRTLDAGRASRFRFLHVSTDEVYGSLGADGAFEEGRAYQPSSPYAASKAASDHFAQAWGRTYGLPVIISHASNNYGPYQYPDKLIPLMIAKALAGEPLPIYGDGSQVRDWIHVADHVRGLRQLLTTGLPGRVYDIGGGNEQTNLALVRQLCAVLDELRPDPAGRHARLIGFVADRPGHDHRYAIDTRRIREEIGWHPEVAFGDGLRETVAWYLANQRWVREVSAGRYEGERLGRRDA